jgi:hypothetical protein
MTKEEAIMFEQSEAFQPILRMRKYDELAKDPTAKMEPLKKYREMCIELLLQNKV